MGKKLTNEEFLQKLKDLGRDDIEPLEEYKGTHVKIKWKCTKESCQHEWYAEPNSIVNAGQGCPKCGILKSADSKRMTQKDFENKLKLINPNIKVIGKYTGSKNKVKVKCLNTECQHEWETTPDCLYRGEKCPICGERKTTLFTNEEVNNRIQKLNQNIHLKSNYTGWEDKIVLECDSGHSWEDCLRTFLNSPFCPFCDKEKRRLFIPGLNDLATTRPDLVQYLKDKEDSKKLTENSNKKIKLVCPNCGHEKDETLYHLSEYGFSCPICGDGISYPNKFIRNFLEMFNIDYVPEWNDDWCKNYRYDVMFELNNKKYLIEADGLQHKTGTIKGRKIKNNDDIKNKLAEENGYIVIRINCEISDPEFIYNNMKESLLSKLFDLDNFDWRECSRRSEKSLLIKVCEYYNNHFNEPLIKISKIFKIHKETTLVYLRKGYKIGIVNINPKRIGGSKIVSVYKDEKLLKNYISATICADNFKNDFGVKISKNNISKIILSDKCYQGYYFKYAETLDDITSTFNQEVDKYFENKKNKDRDTN